MPPFVHPPEVPALPAIFKIACAAALEPGEPGHFTIRVKVDGRQTESGCCVVDMALMLICDGSTSRKA